MARTGCDLFFGCEDLDVYMLAEMPVCLDSLRAGFRRACSLESFGVLLDGAGIPDAQLGVCSGLCKVRGVFGSGESNIDWVLRLSSLIGVWRDAFWVDGNA